MKVSDSLIHIYIYPIIGHCIRTQYTTGTTFRITLVEYGKKTEKYSTSVIRGQGLIADRGCLPARSCMVLAGYCHVLLCDAAAA